MMRSPCTYSSSGLFLLKQIAVWFCAFPLTERSIGVMGSQPDRYSATRISAVSMMSERRFEACTYEVNGVG